MKIAFFVCSNGFGHFHRIIQVCEFLPKTMSIDVYCERYHYLKFENRVIYPENINFIFYIKPNIRWDYILKSHEFNFIEYQKSFLPFVRTIDDYDLVVTDNMVEILAYRPDAILSGSFLWADVFEDMFGNDNELTKRDRGLIRAHHPKIVCNKYVSLASLIEYDNKIEIGWGCSDESRNDFSFDKIVCISPSLNYSECYEKKFESIKAKYSSRYGISSSIHDVENSIFVIRPGLGMITTCVKHRIPIVAIWDDEDSLEIRYLAQRIEQMGIGKAYNTKDEVDLDDMEISNVRENFESLEKDGYNRFAQYVMGLL